MRELKFRQAIFKDGKFHHWNYWGYGIAYHQEEFVGPIEISGIRSRYEVKKSQQYTGQRTGPVGLGPRIYEGDRVQFKDWKPKVVVYAEKNFAGFTLEGTDLFLTDYDAEYMVIFGHIYDGE